MNMKTGFVHGGSFRFGRSKAATVWKSIERENADELASASPLNKLRIKIRMQREFLRRRKEGHKPSPGTLW
jgi:hypothetical protein